VLARTGGFGLDLRWLASLTLTQICSGARGGARYRDYNAFWPASSNVDFSPRYYAAWQRIDLDWNAFQDCFVNALQSPLLPSQISFLRHFSRARIVGVYCCF